MPIYLPRPRRDPRGPDGQGWNRIHFYPVGYDECALRPTDAATLMESSNSWRASYGLFGPCVTDDGDCPNCPLFQQVTGERPFTQLAFGDRVLFRISPRTGQPMLMNKPEQGWGSKAEPWTRDPGRGASRGRARPAGPAARDERGLTCRPDTPAPSAPRTPKPSRRPACDAATS